MAIDPVKAKEYVATLDLRGVPRGLIAQSAADEAGTIFDGAKNQAQVVGANLFSFSQGVTPQAREAISDSALLAQLVANKRNNAESDPLGWFNEYSNVLQKIGWTLQLAGWSDYTAKGSATEVHEQILSVATVALGASPAALAVLTSAVKALKEMDPKSPWLTIFNREAQHARIARFQVGLVSKDEQGELFVELLACLIEATSAITQVLFFKYRQANAHFRANSARVSLSEASIKDLAPAIREKTRAYQQDYVSTVFDI